MATSKPDKTKPKKEEKLSEADKVIRNKGKKAGDAK